MADDFVVSGGSGSKELNELSQLKNIMVDILNIVKTSKNEKFTVQVDTKPIDIARRSIESFRQEVRDMKIEPTKAQLFNTKTIKSEFKSLEDELRKSYGNISKSLQNKEFKGVLDVSDVESFAKSYYKLQQYSKYFGKEFSDEFRGMFNTFWNEASKTSKSQFASIINGLKSQLTEESLSKSFTMSLAKGDALDSIAAERKQQYDFEREQIKANAEATVLAEKQKRAEYESTVNTMKQALKSALDSITGSASKNQFFDVDLSKFSELQNVFMELVNLLTEMGFDTRELDTAFTELGNKIYISKEKLDSLKSGNNDGGDGVVGNTDKIESEIQLVEKLKQEITDLKSKLSESPDARMYEDTLRTLQRLEDENERLIGDLEWYQKEQQYNVSVWSYENAVDEARAYEEELNRIKSEYESLKNEFDTLLEKNRELQSIKGVSPETTNNLNSIDSKIEEIGTDSTNAFNPEKMTGFINILNEIAKCLQNISTVLGKVDEDSSFTNIISSVDILLNKLDEIQQKVGTGVYNIQVNQGMDQTAQERNESVKEYTRKTMTRYSNAYDKIVSRAGDEEKLFAYINNVLNPEGGISELINTFSSINVGKLGSSEEKVYRLINFFKILRQAAQDENFGLDLSGITLPSSSDTTFRSRLRELSGISKKEKMDAVFDFDADKIGLNDILSKLGEIQNILLEISQKDILGETFSRLSSQLDELIGKFENLATTIQTISSSEGTNVEAQTEEYNQLAEAMDKVDQEKADDTTNQVTAESVRLTEEEAAAMSELFDKAIKAAEAKKEFAGANKEVFQSIITSLQALNSEGEGFKNLNAIINKLSNADKMDVLVKKLKEIKKALNSKVSADSFINAIKDLANQGDNLKNLAEVLKASAKELERAKSTVSKGSVGVSSENMNILNSNIEKYRNMLNNISIKPMNDKFSEGLKTSINEVEIKIEELKTKLNSVTTSEGLKEWKAEYGAIKAEIDGVNKAITEESNALKEAETSQKNFQKTQQKANEQAERSYLNQTKMLANFRQWVARNGVAYKAYGVEIDAVLDKLSSGIKLLPNELRDVAKEINRIKTVANDAGKTGSTLTNMLAKRFKSLIAYLGTFASFYRIIGYVRTAFDTIKDLDYQLVDLRKTTTMSVNELNQFYMASSDVAKQLGVTSSEIISQAAAWSRLGYSSKEAATEMAKLSSQFAAISPGMSVTEATDGLVSTMKAFGFETNEVLDGIMSKINIIGNTAATSNSEIVQMLQRSSSAMAEANNTLEETIALETAAVEITRNAENVGTMFKTLSMRARGYDEEGEILEDYEELKGKIADLTKTSKTPGGLSLFTDETKNEYKSTYQLLKDIHDIYFDLTDKQQAGLLEALGGKRGGQIIGSVMRNWEAVDKALQNMENSAGAADAEMSIVEQSLTFKINKLRETWVGILQELADRGTIGEFIDDLTTISDKVGDLITNFGGLETAIVALGTIIGSQKINLAGLFNGLGTTIKGNTQYFGDSLRGNLSGEMLGQTEAFLRDAQKLGSDGLSAFVNGSDTLKTLEEGETYLNNMAAAYGGVADSAKTFVEQVAKGNIELKEGQDFVTAYKASFGGLKGMFEKLKNIALWYAITTAISVGVKALREFTNSYDDLIKRVNEATSSFKDNQSSLENYKTRIIEIKTRLSEQDISLEETKSLTSELYEIQNDLVSQYPEYAKGIDLVNSSLDDQIEKLDTLSSKNVEAWKNQVNSERSGKAKGVNTLVNSYISSFNPMMTTMRLFDIGKRMANGENLASAASSSFSDETMFGDLGEKVYGSNIKQITDEWNNFNKSIKVTDISKIKDTADGLKGISVVGDTLEISGNVDDISDSILVLQARMKELGYTEEDLEKLDWYSELSDVWNEVNETISNSQESYKTLMYSNMFETGNEALLDYNNQLLDKYKELKTAMSEGDTDAVDSLKSEYVDLLSTIEESILSNDDLDDTYIKYFEDLYPELQTTIEDWKFKVDIEPSIKEDKRLFSKLEDTDKDELLANLNKYSIDPNNLNMEWRVFFMLMEKIANENGKTIDEIINNYKRLNTEIDSVTQSAIKNTRSIQSLVDTLFAKSDALTTALGEQKDNGFLSTETLEGLQKNFEDYTKAANQIIVSVEESQKISDWGLEKYRDQIENQTIRSQYGNIDMNNRQIIHYDEEYLEKHKEALQSWKEYDEDGKIISTYYDELVEAIANGEQRIDTVFGGSGEYKSRDGRNYNIAFSPILQTENGAEMLSEETVNNYINEVLAKAGEDGEITAEEIFKIDAKETGKEYGEEFGLGLIAGVNGVVDSEGTLIPEVGELMHFSGKYGAIQTAPENEKKDPLYFFTENGIQLNTEALHEYTEQAAEATLVMTEMKEAAAVKEFNREVKVLASLTDKTEKLKNARLKGSKALREELAADKDLDKTQKEAILTSLDRVDAITDEINNYDMLEARIRFATSALNEYIQATETPNLSDNFNTAKTAVESLSDAFEKGWTGTDEFRKGMEYIGGYDFNPDIIEFGSDDYNSDWSNSVKEYIDRAKRYFTDDISGIYNFLDDATEKTHGDVENFISKSAEGIYTIDIDNVEEFAKKMDMSVSSAMDMLLATNDAWDFDVDFTNITDSIRDGLKEIDTDTVNAQGKIEDFEAAIEALEAKGFDTTDLRAQLEETKNIFRDENYELNVTLSEKSKDEVLFEAEKLSDEVSEELNTEISFDFELSDIDKINETISKVKEARDKATNSDDYEKYNTVLAAILQRKYEVEKPMILSMDTSSLTESEQGVISLLDELYQAYTSYQYNLEIGADTSDAEQSIANVQEKLASMDGATLGNLGMGSIDFTADTSKIIQQLGEIDASTIVGKDGATVPIEADELPFKNAVDALIRDTNKKNATININPKKSETFDNTINSWLTNKTMTIKANITGTTGGGNISLPSKGGVHEASGGTVSKNDNNVLVGELGQEIVARNGSWFTVGDNGAEIVPLQKGDIVFNAEQTKQLLATHKINSQGQVVGGSFATGTHGHGDGNTAGSDSWKKNKNSSSKSSGNNRGNGSNSSSTSAEETEETFDWIEVKIQRIEEEIARLDERVENTYDVWTNRNKNLVSEMESVRKEIDIQQAGYQRYLQEANSVGLSAEYAKKVREGLIDIEKIKNNQDLVDKINLYQQWYNKAVECKDAVQTLTIKLGELSQTKFDNVKTEYEELIDVVEGYADLVNERVNRVEEKGYFVSQKYYKQLYNYENQNLSTLQKEYNELIKKRDEAVSSGNIKYGSQAWREMSQDILDVAKSIETATTNLVKYKNEMRQLEWDAFDYTQERIDQITEEAEFLIDLLDNQKLYDDTGNFNDRGWADAALHASEYNVQMQKALDYAKEREKVEKDLAKDSKNKDLIKRREELIKLQQSSIKAAYQEKEAIKSLVSDGINIFLDNLKKLIDEYNKALQDAKSLYDYQKNINEQAQNIGNIQKQLTAYQGDNSEETRATVQKLRKQLEDAQTQLKETEWDKYLSETQDFLDDMYTNLEETLNERLDDIDLLMHDMIAEVNDQGTAIKETVSTVAGDVAYKLTENLSTVLNGTVLSSDFKQRFDTYATTTESAITNIKDNVAKMVNQETTPATDADKKDIANPNSTTSSSTSGSNTKVSQTKRLNLVRNGVDYSSIFNLDYYKSHNADLVKAFGDDDNAYLDHFINYGMKEGRQASETFNLDYYKSQYEDLRKAYGDDNKAYYEHFLKYGIKEGRTASATFNAETYKSKYSDLQKAFGDNRAAYYSHYNNYGTNESRNAGTNYTYGGLDYSSIFDPTYYTNKYSDLKKAFGNNASELFTHFVNYGMKEGRQPSDKFNVSTYANRYPDLKTAFGSDWAKYYIHYLKYGKKEGRKAYAKGSSYIPSDQMAWTQEKGAELIYRTTDGAILTPLNRGDKVFTAEMSENLWNLAQAKLTPVMPSVGNGLGGKNVTNNNAISINLPNVTNYNEFKNELQNDKNMVKFIQQVTFGEATNGVKLNRKKY